MMEPAAPGTEDDEVSVSLPSISKQESEQERLLSIKAQLPNGGYGNVFELNYLYGAEHWYCNVCECPVMGRVYQHEIGKRHSSNMSAPGFQRTPPASPVVPPIQVAPGEPVPPGFEGEIEKTAQIQRRLDEYTVGPLIGLEYLFEIQQYDHDKEPSYLCVLCDKRGDPRTVIAHLASYNHISQYLQKHFPTAYRALSPYATKQYKRNWQNTVQKLAEAIEHKFGRLKPHPVDIESFEMNRTNFLATVIKGKHYSEKNGFTFIELVDKEELTKPMDETLIMKPLEDMSKRFYRKTGSAPGTGAKRSPSPPVVARPKKKPKPAVTAAPAAAGPTRRRSLSSVSSISSSDLSEYEPDKAPKKAPKKPPGPGAMRQGRSPPRRRSRSPPLRKPPPTRGRPEKSSPRPKPDRGYERDRPGTLPWQRSDYIKSSTKPRAPESLSASKKKEDKTSKMEEFKKLATAIESDMSRVLKAHEKNPEKHPQYNEEWKKFWNKRYKELQGEGKDAAGHDFKPEWIVFWNKRMVELHNSEVKSKKDALRRRLGLPEEPAPICFRITGKKRPNTEEKPPNEKDRTPSPDVIEKPPVPEVIVIDDRDDDTISSKRSRSPWEVDPHPRPQPKLRSRDRSHSRSYERDYRSRDRSRERDYRSRSRDRDYRSRSREREMRRIRHEYVGDYYGREIIPDPYKPPRIMRDVTRQPVLSPPLYPPLQEQEPEDDGEINVVSVLRLLTALEEKLGSLGPKVIDLLAQALAMEKNEANSSETLLDNEINCVMFETVKEKLKGQLLAGLVGYNQERAFKNAIKKTASLIHLAGERKKKKEKEKPRVDPVKVPGIGTVDKAAIAKQIATALILQGKTDVTQAELEQLINAVVGMAEASRNSSKPVTTAGFLEQLTQPKPKPEPSISFTLQSLQDSMPDTSSMEGLSDSDLQTLLQNFKDLSTNEQHGLISYLKKLEAKEPERVEKLRKFVNLGSTEKPEEKKETGRVSPFSNRLGGGNPMIETKVNEDNPLELEEIEDEEDDDELLNPKQKDEEKPAVETKVSLDSDEEEYSFEDVFKAAKKNVNEKEAEKERQAEEKQRDVDLKDAKAIIANLMGSFSAKNSSAASRIPTTSTAEPIKIDPIPNYSNVPVNFDKINNIVGNLKNLMEQPPSRPLEQQPSRPLEQQPPVQNFDLQRPVQFQPRAQEVPQGPYAPVQYPLKSVGGAYGNFNPGVRQNVQYPIRPGFGGNFGGNGNFGPPFETGERFANPGGFGGVRGGNPNQYNNRQNNFGNRW